MKKQQQSSLATSNNICPKHKIDVNSTNTTKKLIDKLERGKLSANLMRKFIIDQNSLINDKVEDRLKAFDHHSMVVLDTFVNCLSLLKTSSHQYKFQDFGDQGLSTKTRRGCYKRRKIGDSRQEEVEYLTDDGFAWRKYGQKFIFNSIYPRHYYRCTHSHDQKCKATKQVQQISDNPTKFKLMYHGNHSCITNILNSSPKEDSSTVVLSFDQSKQVNPTLFTTSPSIMSNDSCLVVSPLSSVNCSVPDEMKATSSGVSSNPVSKQTEEVLSAENNSCTSTFDYWDEDYNFTMDDFSQLLPDWWSS